MPFKSPEAKRAWRRARADKNREERKRYKERHPERVRVSRREQERKQRQRLAALRPPKVQLTQEERRERAREHREANREHYRAKDRARVRCPIECVAKASAYRARKRGADGTWNKSDVEALSVQQGGACAYCSASWEHVDHKTPLVRGGSNWPTNLQLLCGHHNTSKGRMTDEEYRAVHKLDL